MRTLIKNLKPGSNKTVEINGWLHKKRLLGGLTFLVIRDRTGLVQIVVDDKLEVEKLRGLQIGTVLKVIGQVVEEPRSINGLEIHSPKISVLAAVKDESPIEIDKPINHNPQNLDTLFEYRSISLRNPQESAIFFIRSEILRYIRDFLHKREFVEIQTPKIVANAAEGGAEVFKLDYFNKEASLAQSPQLYKQVMVGVFEKVFEIGPAFRAELSATTRHVSEVTMLDIEMGFVESHDEVLNTVQDLLVSILNNLWLEHRSLLESIKAVEPQLLAKFPRYSMAEIHQLYSKHTKIDTSNELDLTPDEEKWICEYSLKNNGSEAIFATDLPKAKMKFYHRQKDQNSAMSADLLFRGLELATIPIRENDYNKLVEQMKQVGIDPDSESYKFYTMAFKYGLPMHGGCGFGIDRLVEKTLGLNNIKEAILFPRDINRLSP